MYICSSSAYLHFSLSLRCFTRVCNTRRKLVDLEYTLLFYKAKARIGRSGNTAKQLRTNVLPYQYNGFIKKYQLLHIAFSPFATFHAFCVFFAYRFLTNKKHTHTYVYILIYLFLSNNMITSHLFFASVFHSTHIIIIWSTYILFFPLFVYIFRLLFGCFGLFL